ncbi:MAG: hypothetical protein FWE69_00510 [Clostridiales bacterium]|nr:hypothetical protein [Clostridiales bacterium]
MGLIRTGLRLVRLVGDISELKEKIAPEELAIVNNPKRKAIAASAEVKQPAARRSAEKVAQKCGFCRAPISGKRGQIVCCPYCDADQVL